MTGPAGTFAAPKAHHENDIHVQCTRCRNKHMESDRFETQTKRYGILAMTLACPKCGAHTYYKLDDSGKRK